MKSVQVRSERSARFELFSPRNLVLMCGAAAFLIAGGRVVSLLPGTTGGVTAQGQIAFAPGRDEAKSVREVPNIPRLTAGELRVARFIHRQYQIAIEAAEELTNLAVDVGKTVGLDPMLLLAVMAVESRFNPIAESPLGAKGLMQIIPQYHLQKVSQLGAATDDMLQPWINVLVGAQILREYSDRAGSIEAGLLWYNGSTNDESKAYAVRVLSERDRFARELRAVRAEPKT